MRWIGTKRSLRRFVAAASAALLAACAAGVVAARPPRSDVTVFVNAKVFTATPDNRIASAFAVRDGKFVAVGGAAEVGPFLKAGATRIDLHGAFVTPGLADDHFHGEGGGPGVDLSKVRSIAELLAAVGAAAKTVPVGQTILSNADWHEAQLAEQRLPTAAELDAVVPAIPVVLVRGGHSLVLNSAALAKFGITPATRVPDGGAIARDDSGRLTGRIDDRAKALVSLPPPEPLDADDFIATQRAMNAFGVTAVRIPGFYKSSATGIYPLARQLADRGKLTIRYTILLPGTGFGGSGSYLQRSGLRQDQGDEWVRVGGVKLGVDGGFEGAHLSEPYAEPFGRNGLYSGIQAVPPGKFAEQVAVLAKDGWRLATHAAGDAAIDEVLGAYEQAAQRYRVNGRRWTIEHAFIIRPDQLERARRLGLMLSVQDHLYLAGPSLKKMWGAKRANGVTPLPSLLASGLVVAGGTDSPVISPNPFFAMYHFLSRDTLSGGVMGPEHRVADRAAVLKMFTINYARLIGAEAVRGSIEPGKLADFAVLSADYLTIPVTQVRDLKALQTFVEGGRVHPAANGA